LQPLIQRLQQALTLNQTVDYVEVGTSGTDSVAPKVRIALIKSAEVIALGDRPFLMSSPTIAL